MLMRQTYDKETETRNKVRKFIESHSMEQAAIVFYSPTRTKRLLEQRGIFVTVDYIIRRYGEMGIKNKNGLWVKDAEQEKA